MTERGLPSTDGAPACPFVAFGDDRDGRSTSPDHRHRCFAESPPAPRAVAHQEAYCLSSAFPVCPTFQDWARREAAHARGAGERAETAPTAVPSPAPVGSVDDVDRDEEPYRPADDPPVRRNPPRDWAAPPPWASGSASAGRTPSSGAAADAAAADLLASRSIEGQGLAGSAADRLAGGPGPEVAAAAWSASAAGAAASSADDELAGLVQRRPASYPPRTGGYPAPTSSAKRPPNTIRPTGDAIPGPSWEQMRRYEAYPTIKTRARLPGLPGLPGPTIAVFAGAVGIAALALFMLPALLGMGGAPGGSGGPSRSPTATVDASPTAVPAPTPQVYVIKQGDTLLKVAKKFGITLDALLAANKTTIKNPDRIAIGDQIIIPGPVPDVPSLAPLPSASAS